MKSDKRKTYGSETDGSFAALIRKPRTWFILAGVWLAIGHVSSALLNFITIIGIPFGIQHLKLAGIALAPIGKTIVSKEAAAAARKANEEATVADLRKNA